MNEATLNKLIALSGRIGGIVTELNGITATGADLLTAEQREQLLGVIANLSDGQVTINGITATGAD